MRIIFFLIPLLTLGQPKGKDCIGVFKKDERIATDLLIREGQTVPVFSYESNYGNKMYRYYYKGKSYRATQEYLEVSDSVLFVLDGLNSVWRDSLQVDAERYSNTNYDDKFTLRKAMAKSNVNKLKKQGIALTTQQIDYVFLKPDVTNYIVNLSDKTIRYIWYTLSAYNGVNDYLGSKTVKQIGPIAKSSYAEITDDLYYNPKYTNRVELKMIKIQYMDGSYREIKNPIEKCAVNFKDLNLALEIFRED